MAACAQLEMANVFNAEETIPDFVMPCGEALTQESLPTKKKENQRDLLGEQEKDKGNRNTTPQIT